MLLRRIKNWTRELGRSQGYQPLYVRDIETPSGPAMTTAWEPTPEEIIRIRGGASIYLTVLGSVHPPIKLEVGEIGAEK